MNGNKAFTQNTLNFYRREESPAHTWPLPFQSNRVDEIQKHYEVHQQVLLTLIRIKVRLSMLLQPLTKMVLNYILCITSVYPTDISCSYSVSAFESLSDSALNDNLVSCFFTGLAKDII